MRSVDNSATVCVLTAHLGAGVLRRLMRPENGSMEECRHEAMAISGTALYPGQQQINNPTPIPVLNVTLTLFIIQPSTEVAEENAVKNAHGMRSTEPYSMSMNAMVLKLKRSIMTK
ncbi:hypothetical protein EGR_09938 [Echinococcus granulosus]|uniref:Uncharacterized protein n=1 Tax=Echinococcus granulosus TaxID=6210 RepID=W6U9M4_ECHGR|nr:hypothetical protein EGR_09938 [Echinococcus granulosus]EUB55197.1 hypothetical protein EGR_09938 [Echinococcus granulosus]